MKKVVILGVGNILLSDEGVGVKTVWELEKKFEFPENVKLVDGGSGGFSLIPFIEEADRLLIIDAILGDNPPGTIYRFTLENIPETVAEKISLHELNLLDVLNLVKLRNKLPEEVVIIGIEPKSLEMSLELTPLIKDKQEELIKKVLEELKTWGIFPEEKES
jgi:hydrogenase maturation protease